MEVEANNLKFFERVTLRQLMRQKAGAVTVREARDRLAPQGTVFVAQLVFTTLVLLGLGVVFLPFLALGLAAPFYMIARKPAVTRRWLAILPPDRDGEQLRLA